jgi:hypothetical protein
MRKILLGTAAIFAVFVLSACRTNDDYRNDYVSNDTTTLYLVDEQDNSYAYIPYICDSMSTWSKTRKDGAFVFVEPETCKFDFNGLDGVYGDDFDEVVRIVDYSNDGKGNIPYECSSFSVRSTYTDGSFDYNHDDVCSFYL